ncbi:hypothetical protein Vafri_16032, partial [Volvox africanus]
AAGLAGGEVWAVSLERLCWLVRMAAHCLADSGAGETPLMPLPLSIAVEGGGPAVAAVEGLTAALLGLPALALQEGAAAVLSPRLMESCVWSLARWSDTYLFPEEAEGLPAALVAAYATRGSGQAEAVVDGLARLAATCLVAFPGEAELHGMVCTTLLPVLSRRRPLCTTLLECSRSWGELCGAFAGRTPQLSNGLAPKLQRWLSQSLCQAACGFPSADSPAGTPAAAAAGHYISQLLGPTAAEVRALAARPDLYDMTARADVIGTLCGMLEVLRGGACRGAAAAGPPARAAGWGLISELLAPLLVLQRAFGDDPRVGALLLKLAAAVVEHHVGYLPTDQAHMLMSWVLELLRQYRMGRAARVSVAAAAAAAARGRRKAYHLAHSQGHHHLHHHHRLHQNSNGQSGQRQDGVSGSAFLLQGGEDAARELRALLQLLTHITQRDVALAAAASDGWATASSAGSTPRSVNMSGTLPVLGAGAGGGGSSRGNTPKGPGVGVTATVALASAGAASACPSAAGGSGGGLTVGDNESGVAQVVLTGLDVLLPLLTPELLAAATAAGAGAAGGGGTGGKLARLLFSLLAYMMEVHPHAVVALPGPHFSTLLSCLAAGARGFSLVQQQQQQQQQQCTADATASGSASIANGTGGSAGGGGCTFSTSVLTSTSTSTTTSTSTPSSQPVAVSASGFDGVVVQSALEGLAGLAKYHHQSLINGGRGFGAHQAPAAAGGGPLVPYLVQLLMQIVLMGDVGSDVVELAGDALLPLLQSDPVAFSNLGAALVQSSTPRVANQVGAALAKLLAPAETHGSATAATGATAPGAAAATAAAAASLGLDPRTFDLSRLSRRAFRERLCGVVSELRGLLRVR